MMEAEAAIRRVYEARDFVRVAAFRAAGVPISGRQLTEVEVIDNAILFLDARAAARRATAAAEAAVAVARRAEATAADERAARAAARAVVISEDAAKIAVNVAEIVSDRALERLPAPVRAAVRQGPLILMARVGAGAAGELIAPAARKLMAPIAPVVAATGELMVPIVTEAAGRLAGAISSFSNHV